MNKKWGESQRKMEDALTQAFRNGRSLEQKIVERDAEIATLRQRIENGKQALAEVELRLGHAEARNEHLRAELAMAQQQASNLVALEAAYRQSEQAMLRRLSSALTGGNASTWDEVAHAAEAMSEHETEALNAVDRERDRAEQAERALAATREALWNIAGTIVAVCDSGNDEHARIAVTETSPLVDAARDAITRFGLSNETDAIASARSEQP